MIKFPKYFASYGGFNALFMSWYFWLAILITAFCNRYFTASEWWDLSIDVVPGLVGFSIAGVAIFVSLGSDALRSVIAGKQEEDSSCEQSPFMTFMAMFTHFVVVQLIALIGAFLAKAFYSSPPLTGYVSELVESLRNAFWLFGGFCFVYALLLSVALAVEIFRLAAMIDDFQTNQNDLLSAEEAGDRQE